MTSKTRKGIPLTVQNSVEEEDDEEEEEVMNLL